MFSQRAFGLVSTFSDTQSYSFNAPQGRNSCLLLSSGFGRLRQWRQH
jgi:hypothetical protein